MSLLLITQSLLLPLVLSFFLYRMNVCSEWTRSASLLWIWLLSYFWIRGLPALFPAEALDWVGLFSILILLSSYIKPLFRRQLVTTILFVSSLLVYASPLLLYPFSISMIIELVIISIIATIIFFATVKKSLHLPAMIICISAASLAFVSFLGGSLLLGQLAGALAATMGGFSVSEYFKQNNSLSTSQLSLFLSIYLALVFIGRIYVDLPLFSISLLTLSPLSVLFIARNFNYLASILLSIMAVFEILLTADNSNYY